MRTPLTSVNQFFSGLEVLETKELRIRAGSIELQDGTHLQLSEDLLAHLSNALEAVMEGKSARLETDENLVTPERAGEILGVSRQTIYTWQDEGRLSKIMQGSKRMAPLAEVLEEKEHAAAGKRLLEQTLRRHPESQNAKSLAAEALRSGERWASELARLQDELRRLSEQAGVDIGNEAGNNSEAFS